MDYGEAKQYLERVVALLPRPDKKVLKKLAQYREMCGEWRSLHLLPEELASLGAFLEKQLARSPGELSLRWTELWLNEHRPDISEQVLTALREQGAFSDLQVLENFAK